jgi:hypothetical protein
MRTGVLTGVLFLITTSPIAAAPTCYQCFDFQCRSSIAYLYKYCDDDTIPGGCYAYTDCDTLAALDQERAWLLADFEVDAVTASVLEPSSGELTLGRALQISLADDSVTPDHSLPRSR